MFKKIKRSIFPLTMSLLSIGVASPIKPVIYAQEEACVQEDKCSNQFSLWSRMGGAFLVGAAGGGIAGAAVANQKRCKGKRGQKGSSGSSGMQGPIGPSGPAGPSGATVFLLEFNRV